MVGGGSTGAGATGATIGAEIVVVGTVVATAAAYAIGIAAFAYAGDGTLITFATGMARAAEFCPTAAPGDEGMMVNGSRSSLVPPLIGEFA